MDAIVGLLDGPRANRAFLLRSILTPPWSLRIQDRAPLSIAAMVRGEAWVLADDGTRTRLAAGDVVVLRGPEPYTVADDPATPPSIVIHPDQHCTDLAGNSLAAAMDLGVRTWGDSLSGPTVMLTGTYLLEGEVSQRLLRALPPQVVVRRDGWDSPLVGLLAQEITRDEPGQEAVLDRLLDLLLIAVLRVWFARAGQAAPAWYRAHDDPVVGSALRYLQSHPEHPWTVASLAAKVGVSRATLARRFTELVGESPMAFLTGWRLDLAADLLREPTATVDAVARKVGYGSGFALSAAFRRVRGTSPRDHRLAPAAR
ncbi:AraC family transcriptional regulator [Frankia sp. R82]|uniref:AraC family transcriptional regulator n=1 Tax=Frankia sp. R82 TaxID=2950553 RepID=UPI00204385D8|nr:AraC family transcriptional regulator [Frankia sp. R82]MCM3882881.1 AraC family transcriptional regulator [Frankia sp. R82]